mmetsp:Transcript_38516/g.94748  ORF Transcript_38516/g.94748 Transcript_38516/m.94748 type:complete len:314 (-) Transcript_38516:362-1303(-)
MPATQPPRLFSLPPAWGLPTFHPECLKVQAYMRLAGVRFISDQSTSAAMASYDTPVMVVDDEHVFTGSDEIIQHLRTEGSDLDSTLGQQDRAEVFAFASMVEGQLLSAMLYDWWMVDDNYYQVIKPVYAAAAAFPASILLPWSISRRMKGRLGHPTADDGELLYRQAAACYSALAARLGTQPFFFGELPSTLDAVVFAHLATHLHAPMPSPARLSSMIQKHSNLVHFVERINTRYMGVSLGVFARRAPEEIPDKGKDGDSNAKSAASKKVIRTPKEKARRRRARDFVAFGVILTVGFILFGNWITVEAAEGVE